MTTSLHNSIHLTEMVTILLRRCVCPSGRIINIKINANTHSSHPTVCICQRATASATTTATTINCVIPHMQPYHPMESMSTYNYIYIYRMTPTVLSRETRQEQQLFLMTTYMPLDLSVLSSFHSRATRWFSLSLANVYTILVDRKGLTFSGTNRPSPGLYWNQFVQ